MKLSIRLDTLPSCSAAQVLAKTQCLHQITDRLQIKIEALVKPKITQHIFDNIHDDAIKLTFINQNDGERMAIFLRFITVASIAVTVTITKIISIIIK
jgi:hypothetical protein